RTYSGTSVTSPSDLFTYLGPPTLSGMGTSTGTTAGGAVVTITGPNFTGAAGVLFGDAPPSSFTVSSSTSITATAPPHAAGTVDVTVRSFSGSSPTVATDRFTYTLAQPPTVTGVGPITGNTLGGIPVTITGTNLTGATAVMFGTVPATSFT